MSRIVALNQDDPEEESDVEIVATREAQETIAEVEYRRALQLRAKNKPQLALTLLLSLLDTEVLNKISDDDGSKKLWSIRYNCHKNVAIISEEMRNFGMALQNYVLALQLDNTDVHTIHRFGRFVLKRNAFELAQHAFENCLRQNPTHWNAAEGMFLTLCGRQNILGAYGSALKLYRQNPKYRAASSTLSHIYRMFKNVMPFLENMWGPFPDKLKYIDDGYNSQLFAVKKKHIKSEEPEEISLRSFAMTNMNFASMARYILKVFDYLKAKGCLFTALSVEDMVASKDETKGSPLNGSMSTKVSEADSNSNETPEGVADPAIEGDSVMEPTDAQSVEASADDEGGNGGESSKSKSRRRCSDLHHLEQWGWHKTRRYASRRKGPERPETDTSLKGFLRRMFSKHVNQEFKDEWPFPRSVNEKSTIGENTEENVGKCPECSKNQEKPGFQQESEKLFTAFVDGLKAKPFDVILLIFKWLKNVASLWHLKLPEDIKSLYIQIYSLYIELYDFNSWNMLSCKNFEESTNICLLYLELEYSRKSANGEEKVIPAIWHQTFDHLRYITGSACILLEDVQTYKMRLLYIKYLSCSSCNQLEECLMCLGDIEYLMDEGGGRSTLHILNLTDECLTKDYISNLRMDIQRELELNGVSDLFDRQNWPRLIEIMKDSLLHIKEEANDENWLKDFKVQMEILLQSLWKTASYRDCLIWAERFLHYATYHFLKELKGSYRRILWEESINFTLSYINALTNNEGLAILDVLEDSVNRLVQNYIRILSNYLDPNFDKNGHPPPIDFQRLFVPLHQLLAKEEQANKGKSIASDSDEDKNEETAERESEKDEAKEKQPGKDASKQEEEVMPNSLLILFTAHEFIGKHQWCTKDNGSFLSYIFTVVSGDFHAPRHNGYREVLQEYLEQVTFCLFGYPPKKGRYRHLEEHEATPTEMKWPNAIQLFELYSPPKLPEINSYKYDTISLDMEQLLLRIVSLMPNELDPDTSAYIEDFIKGEVAVVNEAAAASLPPNIDTIFYFLGDYYFKNTDFDKAPKYYKLDLAFNPKRLDSWTGMALSKASRVDSKINLFHDTTITNLLTESDEVIRCFERSIELDQKQTLVYIEYGSFSYTLHSHCSRHLKHNSENLSMEEFSYIEERKERMLQISYNCFTMAANLQAEAESSGNEDESNDERWLSHYMLGKIAEKRKENPPIYLNHYLQSANYLYESQATYPIKINHSNPTTLAVEALEVYYRTNSAMIKYLEHETTIPRAIGQFFKRVLSSLAKSPFAFNKAKIDGSSLNALKRKIGEPGSTSPKIFKESKEQGLITAARRTSPNDSERQANKDPPLLKDKEVTSTAGLEKVAGSPFRRQSQESIKMVATTSVVSSANSSSACSDDTSSESDTETEKGAVYSKEETDKLLRSIIKNLEECVTRFPEHYKSIYRLVFHFLNASKDPGQDLDRCEQLLLTQYRTGLGNQINGLFADRKTNNLFNGIWKNPSSEIDRPGSFAAALAKCISILIQTLMKKMNYNLLIDIGLQLFKTPEADKRYIKDDERIELYRQCITYCAQVLRKIFKTTTEKRDDRETIDLLLNIYKIHKKCTKYFSHKEPLFAQLLVDVYKFYIQDRPVPENFNHYDAAMKLCVQQLSTGKTANNPGAYRGFPSLPQMASPTFNTASLQQQQPSRPRMQSPVRPPFYPASVASFAELQPTADQQLAARMRQIQQDPAEMQRFLVEFYKQAMENKSAMTMMNAAYATPKPSAHIASALPSETTITPSNMMQQAVASKVAPSQLQDAGKVNYDITITPCSSKQANFSGLDSISLIPTAAQGATKDLSRPQAGDTTGGGGSYKEKSSAKSKGNPSKPYSRPSSLGGAAASPSQDLATISLLQSQQKQLHTSYADKLKGSAMSQVQITTSPAASYMGAMNARSGPESPFNAAKFEAASSLANPPKTLQQKLSERQKANLMGKSAERDKPPPPTEDADIIVLD